MMWTCDETDIVKRVLNTDIPGIRKKRRKTKDPVKDASKRYMNTAGLNTVEAINTATWKKKSNCHTSEPT